MRFVVFILCIVMSVAANAQVDSLVYGRDYRLDSLRKGELAIEVDNISFFKDNEYDGASVTGYTLPGFWIQPKLTYQPLKNLSVEFGMHSLIYYGKVKYPSVAYQDISAWKGNDYMSSTHILPYFRANVQMGPVHLVFGNLYGGTNHRLFDPLYSHEMMLTCDPEMGLQLLTDLKHWHFDMWVNWQSFIFKDDTHQEAFAFGANSELKFGRWTIPVQAILQHRGGEIQTDSAHHGVQTLINGAAGVRYEQQVNTSWLTKVTGEAAALLYFQQSGKLYPVGSGVGAYVHAMADFKPGIRLDVGYLLNRDYVSIFGDGHFSCLKTSDRSVVYRNPQALCAAIEYSRTFSKYYSFGARAELYYNMLGGRNICDVNFGVFLKVNPRFLLMKF